MTVVLTNEQITIIIGVSYILIGIWMFIILHEIRRLERLIEEFKL